VAREGQESTQVGSVSICKVRLKSNVKTKAIKENDKRNKVQLVLFSDPCRSEGHGCVVIHQSCFCLIKYTSKGSKHVNNKNIERRNPLFRILKKYDICLTKKIEKIKLLQSCLSTIQKTYLFIRKTSVSTLTVQNTQCVYNSFKHSDGHCISPAQIAEQNGPCSPHFYQCEDGMCLIWDKVNDGIIDCINGSDEIVENNSYILSKLHDNSMKCRKSDIIIYHVLVNDLIPDCPHGDDEPRMNEFWMGSC